MVERIEQQPSSEIKRVKLGEPFKVLPDLSLTFQGEDDDFIEVKPVELEIEGLGRGRVSVTKIRDFSNSIHTNIPAGGFEVKFVQTAGFVEPVKETLPVYIRLEIDKLTKEQLENVTADLILDEKKYEGVSDYDDVELEQDGRAGVRFEVWDDHAEDFEARGTFFPQDADLFKNIQFVVNKTDRSIQYADLT